MILTKTEAQVLELLVATPGTEKYGLEMVKESAGALKRGSIYVLLSRLEDKGFVSARKAEPAENGNPVPHRLYKATGTGCTVFRAYAAMNAAAGSGAKEQFA